MEIAQRGIRSFQDLDVYNNAYRACVTAFQQILPKLPQREQFDLKDQLLRSTKAIPRLIAEGFAKKHQLRGFQKYLDDAIAECNETIVGLNQCKDLYSIEPELCVKLIDEYDKISRQMYKLAAVWDKFTYNRKIIKNR